MMALGEAAFGWVVGAVADGAVTPLGFLRCVHLVDGAAPDWEREAPEVAAAVPAGLAVVGWYAACDGEAELSALIKTHAAALRRALSPAAAKSGNAIFACCAAGAAAQYFAGELSQFGVELRSIEPPSAAESLASFHASHVALRARPLVTLSVEGGAGGAAWAAAHGAAKRAALASLTAERACFAIAEAPHVGIISVGDRAAGGPAPFLAVPCAVLAGGAAAGLGLSAGGVEEEDDEEDDDYEYENDKKKKGGGKKGGGKKGGKKGGGKKGGKKGGGSGGGGGGGGEAAGGEGGSESSSSAAMAAGAPFTARVLWATAPAAGEAIVAPRAELRPTAATSRVVAVPLQLDVVLYAERASPLGGALAALLHRLGVQLEAAAEDHLAAAPTAAEAAAVVSRGHVFRLPNTPYLHTAIYALPAGGDASEPSALGLREAAHRRLGLPMDTPLLRSCNALGEGAAASSRGTPIPGLLRDAHVGLGGSGNKGGVVALVAGQYEYFHYMQPTGDGRKREKYDDCGWGCAYRSLMSIISWFRLAGYTSLPNPTHYEIQQTLVEHCGQDATELLGKKMWLGSQDLGYYLEHMLGVTCKTEVFNSGDDVASGARRLLHHFELQGTPVMIGGGELAFTLLGVDFNDQSGEIRYLIMDPHYQGADDLASIQPKWVGWKSADSLTHLGTKLFKQETFYSFLCPQRPNSI